MAKTSPHSSGFKLVDVRFKKSRSKLKTAAASVAIAGTLIGGVTAAKIMRPASSRSAQARQVQVAKPAARAEALPTRKEVKKALLKATKSAPRGYKPYAFDEHGQLALQFYAPDIHEKLKGHNELISEIAAMGGVPYIVAAHNLATIPGHLLKSRASPEEIINSALADAVNTVESGRQGGLYSRRGHVYIGASRVLAIEPDGAKRMSALFGDIAKLPRDADKHFQRIRRKYVRQIPDYELRIGGKSYEPPVFITPGPGMQEPSSSAKPRGTAALARRMDRSAPRTGKSLPPKRFSAPRGRA